MKMEDIKKIACLGAGVIGSSWAIAFVMNGYDVNVYDLNYESLTKSEKLIRRDFAILVKNNVLTETYAERLIRKIRFTPDIEDGLKDVQFIQESGPEDLDVKKQIIANVDKYAAADAIFATSSSFILISEIARDSRHPARCIGAHPYNPPHLIPLVELSKDAQMPDDAITVSYQLFKKMKKEPVILKKEMPGYLVNKIQADLYTQTAMLVLSGVCTIEDIDKAICFGPGLRWAIMGPNLIYELGGGKGGIRQTLEGISAPGGEEDPEAKQQKKQLLDYWIPIAEQGIAEELANRNPECGNCREGLAEYRDRMLIEILKLHKKL